MDSVQKYNPFIITGYGGPEYFCNRKKETNTILDALSSKRNLTLIGNRRIGKTGLIQHVMALLKTERLIVYADLLSTQDIDGFTNQLTSAILAQFPENHQKGKKFWNWIRSFRPVITFDPLSGVPEVNFNHIPLQDKKHTLHELFHLLEKLDQPVIIALDEFQQITNYPDMWLEAWLRSEIQFLKNVQFIFSGSQTSILTNMFGKHSRPFYQSTQLLGISKIDESDYFKFVRKQFNKSIIKDANIKFILDWTRLHTYYVQYVFNRLYTMNQKLKKGDILLFLDQILREQEPIFYQYRELLSSLQWKLLHAIALENKVSQPTGQEFLKKYGFGNPSSVLRALHALTDKGMIVKITDHEVPYYEVYDVFLSRWLERMG